QLYRTPVRTFAQVLQHRHVDASCDLTKAFFVVALTAFRSGCAVWTENRTRRAACGVSSHV
ncbi:MAG: hypothetical protein DWI54_00450, partial [Chloroflexi bacterium]